MRLESRSCRIIGVVSIALLLIGCRVVIPTLTPDASDINDQVATAQSILQTATALANPSATITATQTSPPLQTPIATWTTTPTLIYTSTDIPSLTSTPAPFGPAAKVSASMPASIPCERDGQQCKWNFTVTFLTQNGISANIEEICRRYIDLEGGVWTEQGGSGCFSTTIDIPANGKNTYSSWVRSDGELMGGTVKIIYSGHDANGNSFESEVTSVLAWPAWPTSTPKAVVTPFPTAY